MPARQASARLSWESAAAFRRYFWQPPRAHGDVIEGREVSFLELFYDLVGCRRRRPGGLPSRG
jgi:hypothetical protein